MPAPPVPDLVLIGSVHTAPPEPGLPAAVLVAGGRVQAVLGADEALARASGHTVVLSADHVTPGFVDAHAHVWGLGRRLTTLDLTDVPTYAQTLDLVRAEGPGEGWLIGRGWDQNDWADAPPGGWPLAADLDAIAPGRPVALTRIDGHAMWVSPAALAIAQIGADTPDPPGGRIVRDARGVATGVLVDTAMDLVVVPEPSPQDHETQVRRALEAIVATGLTGVHDMAVSDSTLAILEALDRTGELPIRIWAYVSADSQAARRLAATGPWSGRRLSVVGVKVFADGALGSRGALLSAPYTDDPGQSGLEITSPTNVERITVEMLANDAQVAVHAIGDAGVSHVLDAFELARVQEPQASGVPLRIEHAQIVAPHDVERFARIGVVASMQPTHCTSDMPWAGDRLGPRRVDWAYAWRTILDAGVPLAFGSDFPIEEVDPGLGLWSATTREDLHHHPEGGWHPEQRVTIDEAIAAFTTGAAYAVREKELGRLSTGAPADLTLWNVDDAGRWRAVATIVGGVVVWRHD